MMTARSTLRAEKYEVTITMSSELELPIVYRLMGCPHANTFRFQSDEVVTKCSRNPSSIRRSLATLNMLSRAFELSRALELLSGAAKAHVITSRGRTHARALVLLHTLLHYSCGQKRADCFLARNIEKRSLVLVPTSIHPLIHPRDTPRKHWLIEPTHLHGQLGSRITTSSYRWRFAAGFGEKVWESVLTTDAPRCWCGLSRS